MSIYRWEQKYWLLLLPLVFAGLLIHIKFWLTPPDSLKGDDIYFIWLEGKRIIAGENPYARVLLGDMRVNDKYATYFPLAYLFLCASSKAWFPEIFVIGYICGDLFLLPSILVSLP